MDNNKFWNNVAGAARKTADNVSAVAAVAYNRGKKQVNIAKLNSDIRRNYQKLGELCYEEMVLDTDVSLQKEQLAQAITMQKKRLESVKCAVDRPLTANMQCSFCGADVRSNSEYCPECNKKL